MHNIIGVESPRSPTPVESDKDFSELTARSYDQLEEVSQFKGLASFQYVTTMNKLSDRHAAKVQFIPQNEIFCYPCYPAAYVLYFKAGMLLFIGPDRDTTGTTPEPTDVDNPMAAVTEGIPQALPDVSIDTDPPLPKLKSIDKGTSIVNMLPYLHTNV